MKYLSSRWSIGTMAFLSGVALGVAAGILWAPQSGRRTREDLQDLAMDALEEAEQWVEATKEKVDDLIETGKAKIKVG